MTSPISSIRVTPSITHLALAAPWLATASACSARDKPAPGEVIVIVSTDLAVPADIDNLRWTVSSGDPPAPVQTKVQALAASDASNDARTASLPATLAVVSGPKTSGPVLIQLDGLSGGASGLVRVHREARLTAMPAQGVKELSMPLGWLCSDANPAAACAPGETCAAGSCVPSSVDPSTLPDYAPLDAGPCFDALKCFESYAAETVPVRSSGRCIIPREKSTALLHPGQLTIALVVDPWVAGSYGACAAGGGCFIPLQPNDPEGWTSIADDGGIVGVALPDAVCALGVGAQISGACASKAATAPLCATPPTCALLAGVHCPSGWVGYSCAGSASASDVDPKLTRCWPAREPQADGGAGTTSNLVCCAPPATPSSDPLLIDDMTGEPTLKLSPPPPAVSAGGWFVATDDANTVVSPARAPASFLYRNFVPPLAGPDGGIASAACVAASSGFDGTYLIEGFDFARTKNGTVPFDVHSHGGVRFLAWSRFADQPLRVDFPDKDTDTEIPKASCLAASDCGNHFGKSLVLTDTPTEYVLPWTELSQQSYPGAYDAGAFDETTVTTVNFTVFNPKQVPYPVPIDVCIAQVYFTPP